MSGYLDLGRADAYGQSFSDVYDGWYDGVSDAAATARFIARRCPTGPVLELGVGSGRLALPLIEQGLTVIGVDGSDSMLARCPPADSLSLVRADMRALPLRASVGAALIAFNTLFNLASEAEQLRLLVELAGLIGYGGVIVIEALDVTALLDGPARSIGVRQQQPDGLVVTATQLDREAQTLTGQHLEIDATGIAVRPWRLRWLTPAQLDQLADRAGLTLDERYGSWSEQPFVAASETHISTYRLRRR
ncbi:MAG: class I SAM-dependent methyltransferase [Acidimicrobiales bacterium]